jgi:hypothetical protein
MRAVFVPRFFDDLWFHHVANLGSWTVQPYPTNASARAFTSRCFSLSFFNGFERNRNSFSPAQSANA